MKLYLLGVLWALYPYWLGQFVRDHIGWALVQELDTTTLRAIRYYWMRC